MAHARSGIFRDRPFSEQPGGVTKFGLDRKLKMQSIRSAVGRHILVLLISAVAGSLGAARHLNAQDQKPGERGLDVDEIRRQLPRVKPLSPRESLARMELHPAMRAELVASEPDVRDPVAIDFDAVGRMYVVELPPYNSYAVEDFGVPGTVRRLEDRDGDGVFETSVVFANNLKYPTAVACWDGGVFVGDAPDLLYLKDEDGDGRADVRRVVLTGFGTDRAGEAQLNSIRWGLDHRFHLSTSLSGGDVVAVRDGKPVGEPVSVRGRGLIFDPRNPESFELTSGGGQHGFSMDDWGRGFVCSNSVPAQTLMIDDRYLVRNPQLVAPAVAVDIAPDGKFTRLFRISPPEPWRELRTRLRSEGRFRGSDEGGKPFGFFTGATGITVYRGDAWPQEFQGQLFVGDVANNLVYRADLQPAGVGVVARRADPDREFLASRDIWFRPVQFANAPDGCLYVLDMYRELIEGAAFLPPEFLETLDAVGGHERGRVYRIAPKTGVRKPRALPGGASLSELVAMLDHPNGWHRDTASRLLYERQEMKAVEPLRAMVRGGRTGPGRLLAGSVLQALGALDQSSLVTLLQDPVADVRQQAIRLAEQQLQDSTVIRDRVVALVDDQSLPVRYQLALSLGSAQGAQIDGALLRLARTDSQYEWMRIALLSSSTASADWLFERLASDEGYRTTSDGQEFLKALAAQVGARGRGAQIVVVSRAISQIPAEQTSLRESLISQLVSRIPAEQRSLISSAQTGEAGAIMQQLLSTSRRDAADGQLDVAKRVQAIGSLRLIPFHDVRPLLVNLLAVREPPEVRAAAVTTLGSFADPAVAELLLEQWEGLGPALRTDATEVLLSRTEWVRQLLAAVEAGTIRRSDLDPARLKLLASHPDERVREQADELLKVEGNTDRGKLIKRYQQALNLSGTASAGREVFRKNCATCHRLEDYGQAVGADLKGITERGLESVVLNILDPNREVKPAFVSYIVVLTDGRVMTGMIASENANSLTIRQPDGKALVVQRADVDELRSTGLSLMPEGLEKQIDPQSMADLLEYLSQVTR